MVASTEAEVVHESNAAVERAEREAGEAALPSVASASSRPTSKPPRASPASSTSPSSASPPASPATRSRRLSAVGDVAELRSAFADFLATTIGPPRRSTDPWHVAVEDAGRDTPGANASSQYYADDLKPEMRDRRVHLPEATRHAVDLAEELLRTIGDFGPTAIRPVGMPPCRRWYGPVKSAAFGAKLRNRR